MKVQTLCVTPPDSWEALRNMWKTGNARHRLISADSGHDCLLTREADLKHYSLLPVFDRADGGELVVEQEEEGARQQAHQAHEHAVVAGVRVLVEDAVETLAAHVNIALVHDGGKDHQGKYLWTGGARGRGRRRLDKDGRAWKLLPEQSTHLCHSASLSQTHTQTWLQARWKQACGSTARERLFERAQTNSINLISSLSLWLTAEVDASLPIKNHTVLRRCVHTKRGSAIEVAIDFSFFCFIFINNTRL